MKRLYSQAAAAVAILMAGSAGAQDYDPSLAAHEAMSQQQQVTGQNALQAHMLDQSVRRNQGARAASGRASPERSRQTCANARRMTKEGRRSPSLTKLLSLCRQGGY